jgi:hypothetical protein
MSAAAIWGFNFVTELTKEMWFITHTSKWNRSVNIFLIDFPVRGGYISAVKCNALLPYCLGEIYYPRPLACAGAESGNAGRELKRMLAKGPGKE